MEKDKTRVIRIVKKCFAFFGSLLLLFLICKFIVYFMPFFIAAILAIVTEPIIKFNMNKLKMSRRMSSIVVVVFTILLIVLVTLLGTTYAIGKLADLSKELPSMISYFSQVVQEKFAEFSNSISEYASDEAISYMSTALSGILTSLSTYVQSLVTGALKIVVSIPRIIVNVIVTILAFVFFTKDRVSIINMINFHFPATWVKKANMVKNEIFGTVGSYLKVYSKIIVITTIELLISFTILTWLGFTLPNIIKLSIIIAIVDILPVLGIGTVLIPWSMWCFLLGNSGLGIALLIIYVILTVIRQLIEPRLVSHQLGIHPIITLFSMYAGFKLIGFSGLILGPFALMVLRLVYADQIKKGLFKSLVED